MAEEQSVPLLSFIFESGTIAYKRSTRGLNRYVSDLTSVFGDYWNPTVKADRGAQYVDDIGVAAQTAAELIGNFDLVFELMQKTRLELSKKECQFGEQSIEISGKTISTAGIARNEEWITEFLKN